MRILAALAWGLISGVAWGQGTVPAPGQSDPETLPTLWQGEKAPALAVGKWVKGGPVGAFEPGKIYVVEFWATWCVPCVKSMPHLAEVQAKYRDKGVTVISITKEDPKNSLVQVEAMVLDKSEVMKYAVAWDDAGRTYDAYMRAARQGGIPCAFVINREGLLAWIGHPVELEPALDGVIDGRLDMKAEAEAARDYHTRRIAAAKAQKEYEAAKKAGDWPAALRACRAVEAAGMANYGFAYGEEFEILLVRLRDYDAAYARGRELVEGVWADDAAGLSRVAWTITAFEGVERRDLALAERAAKRGIEVGPGNPFIWRAMAVVCYRRGEKEKALEFAQKGRAAARDEWSQGELDQAIKWIKGEAESPLTGR